MSAKKFMVLIVQYEPRNETAVEKIMSDTTNKINAQPGEIRCVYQGSDERIVYALEKVLGLTK